MRNRATPTLLAVAAALCLAGCGGGSDKAAPTSHPSAASPSGSSSPVTLPTDGIFLDADATYAPYDDAPRTLTRLERSLLRAPGPYAGDAFDLDAVVAAVEKAKPGNTIDWADAILDQIQPDFAEDAKSVIEFSSKITGMSTPGGAKSPDNVVGRNHFAIVLDASGSMAEHAGSTTRMGAAKAAIRSFAAELPAQSTVSLRLYGNEGSGSDADKALSCGKTDRVYEGSPRGIGKALKGVHPNGWTPLARAVRDARKDIPKSASDALVYVVTDGLESCGGKPLAAARSLRRAGAKPVINVVGFDVTGSSAQLRALARVGDGHYTDVRSAADLKQYWTDEYQRMMDAWSTWQDKALSSISEQQQANEDAAEKPAEAIMDGIDQEWDQEEKVIDALKADGSLDDDTGKALWGLLYDRQKSIWNWAYDNKRAHWNKAYDQGRKAWKRAYALGSRKWSDYYAEQER